jgi:putative cell wall-binding protein
MARRAVGRRSVREEAGRARPSRGRLGWARLLPAVVVLALLVPPAAGGEGRGQIEEIRGGPESRFPVTDDSAYVSGDGRFVAFSEDINAFVRDRQAGRTEPVYRGGWPTYGIEAQDISSDGRFVALRTFGHRDDDWDEGERDGQRSDILVYDRSTSRLELVSVASSGGAADGHSRAASISGDGRYVAFISEAKNLVVRDLWPGAHVFVRDRETRTTQLVSGGGQPVPDTGVSISADGRFVVFQAPGSVLLRDLRRGVTELVASRAAVGSISDDGRYVTFFEWVSDSDGHATQFGPFVWDRSTRQSELVSVASDGRPADSGASGGLISGDGQVVVFGLDSSNLSERDTGGWEQVVYAHDRGSGQTYLVSAAEDGTPGDGWSVPKSISTRGTVITFSTSAPNLVSDYNPDLCCWLLAWDGTGASGEPTPPRWPSARRSGDGQALVSWEPPWLAGGGPVTGYVVRPERVDGSSEGVPEPLPVDGSASSATVDGMTNGVEYRFTVTAVNPVGESEVGRPSNVVITRPTADVSRLAGGDRFATAVAVSTHSYPDGASVVYVATGANYPDALAGAVAAVRDEGPVLLVRRDELPAVTAAEIERLAPERIVVLGGKTAVSSPVVVALQGYAPVSRLAGVNRYATAAQVASTFRSASVAYVATGENFPDALAGSAVASAPGGGPILLVHRDVVPVVTAAALERLGLERIVILGGTAAVSEHVRQELAAIAPVSRLAGDDRYGTAAAIAETVTTATATYVATGQNFPDALVGGAAAALERAPLLLVTATEVPQVTDAQLGRLQPRHIHILGGPTAVEQMVLHALER